MKDYVKQVLSGGVYLSIETDHPGIDWIFNAEEEDMIRSFEGNYREIYDKANEFIYESYWKNTADPGIYIQVNDLSDDGMVVSLHNHGNIIYQYVDGKPARYIDTFSMINGEIRGMIDQLETNVGAFEWFGRCAIKPTIYKLTNGWMIFSSEIVYGKHAYSLDIIADDMQRAEEIQNRLFDRLHSQPLSNKSRYERFNFNKNFENYNDSEECNRLRHKYLRIIKNAYETFDFSAIFEFLDDGCSWGGAKGKKDVIESLIHSAQEMKKNNYLHQCTIVQVGKPIAPLECNTSPDGKGQKCFVGLMYHSGELCMVDVTPRQTLFFRMDISPNGKIHSYYATFPSGDFHPIECNEEAE